MVPSAATVARIHTEGILELLQPSFLDNNVLWFRWTVTVVSMGVVAMETTTCFRGLSFRFQSRWSVVGWAFGFCVHVVTYYLCVCAREGGTGFSCYTGRSLPSHAHTHSSTRNMTSLLYTHLCTHSFTHVHTPMYTLLHTCTHTHTVTPPH